MYRFLVFEKENDRFILPPSTVQHLKVLRLGPKPFLCNYQGVFYESTFAAPRYAQIIKALPLNHELNAQLTLAIGVLEPKALELVLQKATELGVQTIIPFTSTFTSKRADFLVTRAKRLETILMGAAEQSFRNVIPKLQPVVTFDQLFELGYTTIYLAHEGAVSTAIAKPHGNALLIVGPEGGLAPAEVTLAAQHGAQVVSLGPTILRAETAAITLLALVRATF